MSQSNENMLMEEFLSRGEWTQVIRYALDILKSDPENTHAILNLAKAQVEIGRFKEALKNLNSIAEKYSTDAEYYFYLAKAHDNLDEPLLAEESYKKACTIDPKNSVYPIYRIVNLYNKKLFEEIKNEADSFLDHWKESNLYPLVIINAYEQSEKYEKTPEKVLSACASIMDDNSDYNLKHKYIKFLIDYNRVAEVRKIILSLRKKKENQAKQAILFCLSLIYEKREDFRKAERALKKALDITWDINIFLALISLLQNQWKIEEAERTIEKCPYKEDYATVLGRHATMFYHMGKNKEAIKKFRKALSIDSTHKEINWNLGLTLLQAGHLKEGWEKYKYREDLFLKRNFSATYWEGQSLKNKSIMVWSEQGVGDHICFSSLLNNLLEKEKPKKLIFETDSRLLLIMQRSFPEIEIRSNPRLKSDGLPYITDYDYHIPIASLACFYRNKISDFPKHPHLKTCQIWEKEWKKRISKENKKYVGISWRSGDRSKSRDIYFIDVPKLGNLFKISGIEWVNLQYDYTDPEVEFIEKNYGIKLRQWEDIDLKNDFEAVAALIKELDLVITPPTAVMQLAGAVTGGKNIWPFITDPNWSLLGQNYSPWLPEARVYRTQVPTPIHHTLPRMSEDLRKWLQGENMSAGVVMCEEQDESLFTTQISEKYSDALSCEEKLARGDITTTQAIEATFSQSLIKRLSMLSKYEQVEPLEQEILQHGGMLTHYIEEKINQPTLEKELLAKGTGKKTLLIFFQGNINMALPQSEVTPYLAPKFAGVRLFEEILQDYPDTCYLGVRDSWQMWYQVGPLGTALADQGLSAQQRWLSLLNAKIEKSGCQEIICLGTSAGASAAIQFGAKLNAKAVLAISPQAKPLDNEWEIKEGKASFMVTKDVQWRKQVKEQFNIPALDLKPYAEELGSRLQLFVPKLYEADLIHANYLANTNPNIQVHRSPGKDHADVSKALFKKALIEQIIK